MENVRISATAHVDEGAKIKAGKEILNGKDYIYLEVGQVLLFLYYKAAAQDIIDELTKAVGEWE